MENNKIHRESEFTGIPSVLRRLSLLSWRTGHVRVSAFLL
jgi:hypothetical protein